MFVKESSGRQPCRIRLEGDPGVGKTLYCHKIAYDWARGLYPQFEMVFLLECKNMRNSIIETCFDQLLPEDLLMQLGYAQSIDYKEVLEELARHQEHVLFIFDGYDELPEHKKADVGKFDVDKVVHSKLLRRSTVVITSRPYECNDDLKTCDAFYSIQGFSAENRDAYVVKHFQDDVESGKKLLQKLSEQKSVSEISCNPLNLVLICLVWSVHQRSLPDTMSSLYWEIFVYIIKRYCERNGIEMSDEKIPAKVFPLFQKLGKLAYDGLCNDDTMSFSVVDIRRGYHNVHFIELGFMKKERSYSKTFEHTTCSFLHRTFQEALCAWYVSQQSAPSSTFFARFTCGPSNRLLSRFLAGFMGEKSLPLFLALAQTVQTIDTPSETEKFIRIVRTEMAKTMYDKLAEEEKHGSWFNILHTVNYDALFHNMVKAGCLQTICECFYECKLYHFLECFSSSFWEILSIPMNMTYEFEQGLRKVIEYQDENPQQVTKITNVICGQPDSICDTFTYAYAQVVYLERVKRVISGCKSIRTLEIGLSGTKVSDGFEVRPHLICEVICSLPNLERVCLSRLDDTIQKRENTSSPTFDLTVLLPVCKIISGLTVKAFDVKGHFKEVPLLSLRDAKNIQTLRLSLNGEDRLVKRPVCSCLPWPRRTERVCKDFMPELCSFIKDAESIRELDVDFRNCLVDLGDFLQLCQSKETLQKLGLSFGQDTALCDGSWHQLIDFLNSPNLHLDGLKLRLEQKDLCLTSLPLSFTRMQNQTPLRHVELYGVENMGGDIHSALLAIKELVEQNSALQSLVVGFGDHNEFESVDNEDIGCLLTVVDETLGAISGSASLNRFEMIGWEAIPGVANQAETLITAVTNLITKSKSIQTLSVAFHSRRRGIVYGSPRADTQTPKEETSVRDALKAIAERNRTLVSVDLTGWDVVYGGGTTHFISDLTDILKQNRVLRNISIRFLQKENVLFHVKSAKGLLAALTNDDALVSIVLDGFVVSPNVLALFKEFQKPKSMKNVEFKLVAESKENSTFDEALESLADSVIQMLD